MQYTALRVLTLCDETNTLEKFPVDWDQVSNWCR
jgi:hypothetical protein